MAVVFVDITFDIITGVWNHPTGTAAIVTAVVSPAGIIAISPVVVTHNDLRGGVYTVVSDFVIATAWAPGPAATPGEPGLNACVAMGSPLSDDD